VTVTFTGTNISAVNDNTGFSVWKRDGTGGTPSAISESDVYLQGTGACSVKVSNQGVVLAYATSSLDLSGSGTHLAIWGQMLAGPLMKVRDSTTVPGLAIFVSSDATLSSGSNYKMWAVDGSDTYPGGWVRYIIDLSKTASTTQGTLSLSSVEHVGFYCNTQPNVAKFDNLVIDRIDYLTPGEGLRFTGTSPDGSWSELYTADNNTSNKYGVIERQNGIYIVQGSIEIGDDAGTGATTWDEASGSVVVFKNPRYYNGTADALCVSDDFYQIKLVGNATGATNITWGDVVGSGDSRQGIGGGSIRTAGPDWSFDAAADIGHLTAVDLYGVDVVGAGRGVDLDDGNKTSVVSCAFIGCGEVTTGSTNNGAEVLSCVVIDPDDAVSAQNRGIELPNTTHNVKKVSFITSGTPTTQHMTHLSQAADYSIGFDEIKFFGSYSSSTIWHGENSGSNADVTINPSNGADPLEAEFNNTSSGTVDVANPAVTLTVTVKDENNSNLQNARVLVEAGDGTGDLPFEDTVTITRSGSTASVSHTAHGLANGDKVAIRGADQQEYNGAFAISNVTTNAYDYTVSGTPATPATGTITGTGVAAEGLTNASGQVTASKGYSVDQNVRGSVRKATTTPRYKPVSFTDTIDKDTGLPKLVQMVRDD